MESLRVLRAGMLVVLHDDRTQKALVMHYQAARELARVLQRLQPGDDVLLTGCHVVADAGTVHLTSTKAGWISFPLINVTIEVAAALITQAAQAEEQHRAEQIIRDGGIMAWMGLPFGLSDNPQIQQATKSEAEKYCSSSRRPLHGIEPRAIVGAPSFLNHGSPR